MHVQLVHSPVSYSHCTEYVCVHLVLLLEACHVAVRTDSGHLCHVGLQLCRSDEVTPAFDELHQCIMDEGILFLWGGVGHRGRGRGVEQGFDVASRSEATMTLMTSQMSPMCIHLGCLYVHTCSLMYI